MICIIALELICGCYSIIPPSNNQQKTPTSAERYSFWKGDIDNFYYILDENDKPLHKVVGKPFMVLEYDPVSGVPLKCEFGLSEARNVYLPGAEGAVPEPFMSADNLQYAKRLDLKGSVDLLLNWEIVSTREEFSGGGFEFWVKKPANMWGQETYHFTFTFDGMQGEIINPTATWSGRYSDVWAFKLLRKFNSNTIEI